MEQKIRCKRCLSDNVHKAGIAKSGTHRYQRYYCNECYRISTYKIKEVEASPATDLTSTNGKTNATQ